MRKKIGNIPHWNLNPQLYFATLFQISTSAICLTVKTRRSSLCGNMKILLAMQLQWIFHFTVFKRSHIVLKFLFSWQKTLHFAKIWQQKQREKKCNVVCHSFREIDESYGGVDFVHRKIQKFWIANKNLSFLNLMKTKSRAI